jgi:hypothetical protein
MLGIVGTNVEHPFSRCSDISVVARQSLTPHTKPSAIKDGTMTYLSTLNMRSRFHGKGGAIYHFTISPRFPPAADDTFETSLVRTI